MPAPYFILEAHNLSEDELESTEIRPLRLQQQFCSRPYPTARIILGDKGMGKSLLLRKKFSSLKKDSSVARLFSPSAGPRRPNRILAVPQYQTIEEFRDLWIAVILLTYCVVKIREYPSDHPDHKTLAVLLDSLFPHKSERSERWNSDVVNTWEAFTTSPTRLTTHRLNEVVSLADDIADRQGAHVIVFCDAIDEGMVLWALPGSNDKKETVVRDGNSWIMPWLFSQAGFLLFIDWLQNQPNFRSQLIAFGTMRPEATNVCETAFLELCNRPMAQAMDLILSLNYQENDLEEILENNVSAGVNRDERSYLKHPISHWRMWDGTETVAQCIIRHSLWRPRDVIEIGKQVDEMAAAQRTNSMSVSDRINKAAWSLMNQHKPFMVPPFEPIYEEFLLQASTSTFKRSAVPQKYTSVVNNLFSNGLLGYVHEQPTHFEIRFRGRSDIQDLLRSDEVLRSNDVFFMHPMLIEQIFWHRRGKIQDGAEKQARRKFSSPKYMIGNGVRIHDMNALRKSEWTVSALDAQRPCVRPLFQLTCKGQLLSSDLIINNSEMDSEADRAERPDRKLNDAVTTLAAFFLICAGRSSRGEFSLEHVLFEMVRAIHHGFVPPKYIFGGRRAPVILGRHARNEHHNQDVQQAQKDLRNMLARSGLEDAVLEKTMKTFEWPLVNLVWRLTPTAQNRIETTRWWHYRQCEKLFGMFGYKLENQNDGVPRYKLQRLDKRRGPVVDVDLQRTEDPIVPFDFVKRSLAYS